MVKILGVNPELIKLGLDVKKYLQKNPLECLGMFTDIVETKDKTGFLAVYEFKFKDYKSAEMFQKMYELANELGV